MRFGRPYEGPTDCVHGGVIAGMFDELLLAANLVNGRPCVTGTLTVRYHRTTPLLADLQLAARPVGADGRRLFCWGGVYHDGVLLAEAEGTFVAVDW